MIDDKLSSFIDNLSMYKFASKDAINAFIESTKQSIKNKVNSGIEQKIIELGLPGIDIYNRIQGKLTDFENYICELLAKTEYKTKYDDLSEYLSEDDYFDIHSTEYNRNFTIAYLWESKVLLEKKKELNFEESIFYYLINEKLDQYKRTISFLKAYYENNEFIECTEKAAVEEIFGPSNIFFKAFEYYSAKFNKALHHRTPLLKRTMQIYVEKNKELKKVKGRYGWTSALCEVISELKQINPELSDLCLEIFDTLESWIESNRVKYIIRDNLNEEKIKNIPGLIYYKEKKYNIDTF